MSSQLIIECGISIIFLLLMRKQSFLQNWCCKWLSSSYILFLQIDYILVEGHDSAFVARPYYPIRNQ